jgi:hypothetical protein
MIIDEWIIDLMDHRFVHHPMMEHRSVSMDEGRMGSR